MNRRAVVTPAAKALSVGGKHEKAARIFLRIRVSGECFWQLVGRAPAPVWEVQRKQQGSDHESAPEEDLALRQSLSYPPDGSRVGGMLRYASVAIRHLGRLPR